jgi:hypothetical protein
MLDDKIKKISNYTKGFKIKIAIQRIRIKIKIKNKLYDNHYFLIEG